MKASDVFPSNYINKDFVQAAGGVLSGRIRDVVKEQIKDHETGKFEDKPVMYLEGEDAGFILSARVNWDSLASAYGEDSDGWRGNPVEIYIDPDITFKGKRTGGVRVRVPQQAIASGAVKMAANDSLMGPALAAKMTAALHAESLRIEDLRAHLGMLFPKQLGLVACAPHQWPQSWRTAVNAWIVASRVPAPPPPPPPPPLPHAHPEHVEGDDDIIPF